MKNATRRTCAIMAAAVLGCSLSALAIDFPEVEPNDSKATPNIVAGMAPGDTISGLSTGTSTTVAGDASADNFDITTSAAGAPGIYRYELTITTAGTAGHAGSIRGLTQTGGVINSGTDAAMQTSSSTASAIPARTVVWYANENPSRIIYRVTGTGTTSSTYTATLARTGPIAPVAGPSVAPGSVLISSIGQTSTDTDMWVYDSSFNPIVDFANDDESVTEGGTGVTTQSRLNRVYAPGTYILAISSWNTCNNLASPATDDYRGGIVLDYPNALANSQSTTATNDVDVTVNGTPVTLNRPNAFGITFMSFTVVVPAGPTITASSASPDPVGQGSSTLLSATVTPGPNGPATSVTGDLSAFGLSMTQAFSDPELDGIWTYNLNVPGAQTIGAYNVALTATDAMAATGSGFVGFNVIVPPPANDMCSNAMVVSAGAGAATGTNVTATTAGDPVPSCQTNYKNGVWFDFTAGPSGGSYIFDTEGSSQTDTVLALYDACGGTQLACDDDTGTGNLSTLQVNLGAHQNIRIMIATWGGATAGGYNLNITDLNTGACCTGGSCTAGVTQAECESGSGVYQGNTTVCGPCSCIVVANDECSGATPVVVGSNAGDSSCATTSFSISPASLCGTFGGSGASNDVWHSFHTAGTGDYIFDTCGVSGFDSVIAIYDSCPADGSVAPIACNDDAPTLSACVESIRRSSISVSLAANTTYYIRVAGYGTTGGPTGPYSLNITAPMAVDGACCIAGSPGVPASCSVMSAGDCATAGGSFQGNGSTCEAPGNPTTCCPANFNGENGVSVQDIFDFLSDWSSQVGGGPITIASADFNVSGDVTVQDIFDFLSAWSAGCN
jgi:hypothetical protein